MNIKIKYAALVSYVGSGFCGWQRQKAPSGELPSIQATLEETLFRITRENPSVVGSGRTDAGVHAAGQVAHFILSEKEWECAVLERALNSHLPRSIRILRIQKVPFLFHAQRSAEKKQYSYYFQQGPAPLPSVDPYSLWIRKSLDLVQMQQALDALKGEHDFKAFQATGSHVGKSSIRTIFEAEIRKEEIPFPWNSHPECHFVRIRLIGSGFLKQMVRGIAGTLLEIGEKRRPSTCISEILMSLDRSEVGPTASGRGLWLEKLWYPSSLLKNW